MMRALFNDKEIVRHGESVLWRIDLAEPLPDLGELRGQQITKERTNTDVREIIASSSDRGSIAGVITVLGMIKRLLHEPGEGLRAAPPYFSADELDKLSLQSENVERPTPNVQYSKCSTLNPRFDVGR